MRNPSMKKQEIAGAALDGAECPGAGVSADVGVEVTVNCSCGC
jgi:hypothetical protein